MSSTRASSLHTHHTPPQRTDQYGQPPQNSSPYILILAPIGLLPHLASVLAYLTTTTLISSSSASHALTSCLGPSPRAKTPSVLPSSGSPPPGLHRCSTHRPLHTAHKTNTHKRDTPKKSKREEYMTMLLWLWPTRVWEWCVAACSRRQTWADHSTRPPQRSPPQAAAVVC